MKLMILAMLVGTVLPAAGQDLPLVAPTDSAATASAMADLARAVIARYREGDRSVEPGPPIAAELVAGDLDAAVADLDARIASRARDASPVVRARDLQYAIYAHARAEARGGATSFEAAYRKEFRDVVGGLDDRTAAIVVNLLDFDPLGRARRAVAADLARQRGKTTIALEDAVRLVRDYGELLAYGAIAATTPALLREDDARRYEITRDVEVRTPDGATVCALVVRPLHAPRLPALLEFTIYNDPDAILRDARRAASNGYIGVIGLTRGKGCSPGPIVPYEHDGADAAALIDWIASQPWSDGRVGMYGGSYSGFTPWAAAKHQPRALKAIVVGAPNAPGLDSPMEGNVFWNFLYPWPFFVADDTTLDQATYGDAARWQRLNHDWYVSGRAYRDLDEIDGTPNPIFDRWVAHGSYDAYWQALIPYRQEYARIRIPVLMTAGYYYGGPGAATYYFDQVRTYSPKADVCLLIGPYDHFLAQRGTTTPEGDVASLAGLALDPVARIDLTELRFRWFDYALKGAARPALLADRVNYEVPGADVWKHAPSLAGMARAHVRYYLGAARDGAAHRLVTRGGAGSIAQSVDLADRRDVDLPSPGGGVLDTAIDTTNALTFVSEPFAKATELSGSFSGHLEFVTNKRDFDLQVALYARMPDGRYLQLAPYWSRASFVADLAQRHLLVPGAREVLDFRASRLMSARLPPGSRLVAVLGVIKNPGQEINYGTGGTVAAETIADAGAPLTVVWSSRSYLEVPLGR